MKPGYTAGLHFANLDVGRPYFLTHALAVASTSGPSPFRSRPLSLVRQDPLRTPERWIASGAPDGERDHLPAADSATQEWLGPMGPSFRARKHPVADFLVPVVSENIRY